MAERRRRRRLHASQDSELSEDDNPLPEKETDGESDLDKTPGGATSEYESAEEEEEPSEDEQNKGQINQDVEPSQTDDPEKDEPIKETTTSQIPNEDSVLVNDEKDDLPSEVIEREPEMVGCKKALNQDELVGEKQEPLKQDESKDKEENEKIKEEGIVEYEEELEEEERQDGDGQECAEDELLHQEEEEEEEEEDTEELEPKSLDDDEDRRNPQYIPKKGAFYEHDDRVCGEFEENKEKEKKEKEPKKKKKLWRETSRWGHDMFIEEEQGPKSREELINAYGYDIRGEDGPPRARRRKRYSRGQKRYNRSWEDENAYLKSGAPRPFRGGQSGRGRGGRSRGTSRQGSISNNTSQGILRTHSFNEEEVTKNTEEKIVPPKEREDIVIIKKEEFPALPTTAIPPHHLPPSVTSQHSTSPTLNSPPETPSLDSSPKSESSNKENTEDVVVTTLTFENSRLTSKPRKNDQLPPRFREENAKQRGRGNPRFGSRDGRTSLPQKSPIYNNHYQEEQLAREFEKVSLHQPKEKRNPKKDNSSKSDRTDSGEKLAHGSMPKVSHQNEPSSRPKRYSSLRPRNVPESYHAPEQAPLQPPTYFEATAPAGNFAGGAATLFVSSGEGGASQPPPSGHSPPPPILATSFAPYQERGAYTLTPATITTAASRIYPPPPGPPYLAAPPTYAPHPAAAPPPPAGYPQYPFQQFVAPAPPPPNASQPSEYFIGGITYYNMMTQHLARAPPKREKKSIAIVNPSEATTLGEDLSKEEYEVAPSHSPELAAPPKDSQSEQACNEMPPSSSPPSEAMYPSPPLVSQSSTVQVES